MSDEWWREVGLDGGCGGCSPICRGLMDREVGDDGQGRRDGCEILGENRGEMVQPRDL